MKRRKSNYNILDNYNHFVPGISELVILVIWFVVGAILGNLVNAVIIALLGKDVAMEYGTLISYPLMFIPPMIYASLQSRKNEEFRKGYKLDNRNFSPLGGLLCAILAVVGTLALAFATEPITNFLPEMPKWIKDALESMTEGNFLINFLCVSIFAPFFEEWLCRGVVLRGLLNCKARSGRGINPVWAIVISALFFAVIHLNPWQAIPAFLLGALFGYVYYRTGSIKLTMLMHFTNNTFALVLSQLPSLEGIDTWRDIIPEKYYWVMVVACVIIVLLTIKKFTTIKTLDRQGSCEQVKALFDE